MPTRTIPPIGTKGQYTLNAPWSTTPGVLYECAAIRSFVDLENFGTDVFAVYYDANGLTQADYETDRRNDEVIITLVSETVAPIYVPSSYIVSYPDLSHHVYSHVVLSASLGALPDKLDLTFMQSQMGDLISDTVGVVPEIHLSKAPSTGVISPSEHETLEAARIAAINNRTTPYSQVAALQQERTQLEARLAILEEIIRINNLIPS